MKKLSKNNPSVANATAPFAQGSLRMRATLGGWALPVPLYYKGETCDKQNDK